MVSRCLRVRVSPHPNRTVAGALDESFSNESVLELWQPSYAASASATADAKPLGSISTSARFNRLALGYAILLVQKGLLAAGLENGELAFGTPGKILSGSSESEAQVIKNTTHTGPVRGPISTLSSPTSS